MRRNKGSILMTNFLYTPQVKNYFFNNLVTTHKTSSTPIKVRIAHDISETCTKPLLIALLKMNQNLTSSIVDYIGSATLDRED